MKPHPNDTARTLAVSASARGVGYAVMEGPYTLLEWGAKEARGEKNLPCRRKVHELVLDFDPDVLVVEDVSVRDSRRGARVRRLVRQIERHAAERAIDVRAYPRAAIRWCFGRFNARSKDEIARALAHELPELGPLQPPKRKPWMSEAARMGIFDAVALVWTLHRMDEESRKGEAA